MEDLESQDVERIFDKVFEAWRKCISFEFLKKRGMVCIWRVPPPSRCLDCPLLDRYDGYGKKI